MSNYTQEQVDALRAALARGVTEVSVDGETVKYASLAAMRRQLTIMEADRGGGGTGPRVHYPATGRGL